MKGNDLRAPLNMFLVLPQAAKHWMKRLGGTGMINGTPDQETSASGESTLSEPGARRACVRPPRNLAHRGLGVNGAAPEYNLAEAVIYGKALPTRGIFRFERFEALRAQTIGAHNIAQR